jgi:hypothetical protein
MSGGVLLEIVTKHIIKNPCEDGVYHPCNLHTVSSPLKYQTTQLLLPLLPTNPPLQKTDLKKETERISISESDTASLFLLAHLFIHSFLPIHTSSHR